MPEDNSIIDIKELSELSGHSVRNIRAYLQMDLLHQGQRRGRSLEFNDSHVRRLHQVDLFRKRGYSLAAIKDVVSGDGRSVLAADVATFGAFIDRWLNEDEHLLTMPEVQRVLPMSSAGTDSHILQAAIERGIARVVDDGLLIVRPELFRAAIDLVEQGMDLTQVLEEFDAIERLLATVSDHVRSRFTALYESKESSELSQNSFRNEFWPTALLATSSILTRQLLDPEYKSDSQE